MDPWLSPESGNYATADRVDRDRSQRTRHTLGEAHENRKKPHAITLTIELRDATGRVLGSHVIERKSADKPAGASAYPLPESLAR